jgi:hypothetical protein
MDAEIHNIRKRKRDSSSEKKLLSVDEKKWIHREGKAVDKGEAVDSDYLG